jgi:hypothetical protein
MTAEERSPSMSESTDDFTHLTAERCLTSSSVSLLSKSLYGQVSFVICRGGTLIIFSFTYRIVFSFKYKISGTYTNYFS